MSQDKDSVKIGNNFKWFLGVGLVLVLLFSIGVFMKVGSIQGGIQADYDAEKAQALAELTNDKDLIISEKDRLITELQNRTTEVVEDVGEPILDKAIGYLIDELLLRVSIDEVLSDREVSKLLDFEVEVDDKDYDAEEVFTLAGWMLEANDEDFLGDVYMTIPKDGVEYKVVFDLSLNTSTIDDEDRSLEFSFLGMEVEVVEWNDDELTFFVGTEYTMTLDETLIIEDREVVLSFISEDAAYVVVDGVGKKLGEGETGRFNGLEIKVDTILYSGYNSEQDRVQLVIGLDVENSVSDGEEYAEDSIWEWVISKSSIGIVLKEEYMELDDELKPLNVGESLCLPNDYICVVYDGVVEEDMEEYSFELDTRDGVDYVEVRGNFQSGLSDYDELLFNITGIYDEDEVQIFTNITVGDSDNQILFDGTNIVIQDFTVNLDLNSSSAGNDEEDYRTDFGILVSNPEDSVEDEEWSITVPEEKLEAIVRVY